MKPVFKYQDKGFNRALRNLARVVDIDAKTVVKSQAIGLAKDAMTYTQPWGTGSAQKRMLDAPETGSIERGFKRIVNLLSPDSWRNPRVRKLIEEKKFKQLEGFLKHVAHRDVKVVDTGAAEAHHRHHKFERRAPKVAVVDAAWRKKRAEKLRLRAGTTKAGFAKAAFLLGATKFPEWIKRHIMHARCVIDSSGMQRKNPFVRFGSGVPKQMLGDFTVGMWKAIDRRERKMVSMVRKIVRGYGYALTKDGLIKVFPKPAEEEAAF